MLEKIVKKIQIGKNLILMHQNADGDAIGSAIALKLGFQNVDIGVFEGVSKIAKKILGELDCKIIENPNLENYNKIIVLDTSSPSQLEVDFGDVDYIIIDHHTKSNFWINPLYYYCDETKTSCSEIIYQILKLANIKISKKIAIAILCGILTDTSHLRFSNNNTFLTVFKILEESKLDFQHLFSIIEDDDFDTSKKIAHLKAFQRMKFDVVDDVAIAYTKLGAFEGSASKALVSVGADIAFVGSQHGKEARISVRAKNFISEQINIGKFMVEIGRKNNCKGGGHVGAGGLSCIGDVDKLLKLCVEKMKQKLKHNTYNK